MSKDIEKKLLAEAFEAFVNDNNLAKATRLFKRQWDLAAKNRYAMLESVDDEFDIETLGDDFNEEIVDGIGDDMEEKFNQVQIAIDELETKFPGEMTPELETKIDELRNIVDEIRLGDEANPETVEEAVMVIEDIKGEFELVGDIDDETNDLFEEITVGIQGEEVDSEMEEINVEDDDMDMDIEGTEDLDESEEFDLEFNEEETPEEEPLGNDMGNDLGNDLGDEESFGNVQSSEEDLIFDIEEDAEALLDKINQLKELEADEDDLVEEGWTKGPTIPRNKMTSEEEGVVKKGMKLYKGPMSVDKKVGMNVASTDSKGKSPDTKVKVSNNDNRGAKQWSKVAKPANSPAKDKSMLGK